MFSNCHRPPLLQLFGFFACVASYNSLQAEQSIFSRPVAVAVTADGAWAYIGNHDDSFISKVDTNSFCTTRIEGAWTGLMDLKTNPASSRLLAIANNPPQLFELSADDSKRQGARTISLPSKPAKLAVSMDGGWACISMTWNHAVCIVELVDKKLPEAFHGDLISLSFQPKEVLSLANGLFLVADAFGDQLAVIDANSAQVIASHKILGHHIGGLARDESMQTIAITHQKLSVVAHTNRDDIHWGTLMQNLVSTVPESMLIDPTSNIPRTALRFPLGDVGHGAADPSGVVAWDGRLAIAIAGSNQIAFRDNPRGRFQYIQLDQSPNQVARVDDSRLVSISTLGNKATIMEVNDDRSQVLTEIGQARSFDSAEDRGEAAFFSGSFSHDRWMTCSSCHVDCHSPDLSADTKGDGRFGNPKRIPSLLNVSETGPWTWIGIESSLEGQIKKTLMSTMHRDESSRVAREDDESVARDITAFLRKQKLPTEEQKELPDPEIRRRGQVLFEGRGCIRCHIPAQHYTSRETFDVGVVDEFGQSQFNPPSLEGISHRKSFFHDGRYKSITEVLKFHPDAKSTWTQDEATDLLFFLKSL